MGKKLFWVAAICFASHSQGTTLFVDGFEGGLGAWQGKGGGSHNATIVSDPLQGDNAMTFTALNSAGDIFTTSNSFSGATGNNYILEFDYLGTCGNGNCGGFIGYSQGLPGSHVWLGGTGSGYPDLLPDTGVWEHVTIAFTSAYASFHLMLEDFSGSGGAAGDAFFDNILLTDANGPSPIPEPAGAALLGLGLAGIALRRKRRN